MAQSKYPWEKWFKKKSFTLKRSKKTVKGDYDCLSHAMAQQIRNAAFRYRKKVSIHFGEGDTLSVKVEADLDA